MQNDRAKVNKRLKCKMQKYRAKVKTFLSFEFLIVTLIFDL